MTMRRWILRSTTLGVATLVAAAPVVAAQWQTQTPRQGRELFEWRGRVDREVQIVMRGDRVWTNNVGWTEPNDARSRTQSSLPRTDGEVMVRVVDGRGRVDVIQQPSARNGYTTIVRIVDPRSGSDNYRLSAYWQGYANGDVYGRNGDIYDRSRDDRSHGRRGDEMKHRNRDDDWNDDNGRRNDRNRESVLHWSGNVDDELEIRLQNGRLDYRTIRGAQPTSIRVNAGNMVVDRSGSQLAVVTNQGRGVVTIIQHPNLSNGYTTVMRVRDPQGGYGYYDFDLIRR